MYVLTTVYHKSTDYGIVNIRSTRFPVLYSKDDNILYFFFDQRLRGKPLWAVVVKCNVPSFTESVRR